VVVWSVFGVVFRLSVDVSSQMFFLLLEQIVLCFVGSVVQFIFVLLFSFSFRLVGLFVFLYLCWLVVVVSVLVYCVESGVL